MAKLKLDLHDIYNRGKQIDVELNRIVAEAIDRKIELVEIIPGKGSGQLKKKVLRLLVRHMNHVPTGTVTFLFTDIEGSTKLAQEHPDSMPSLLARHNELLKQAIEGHNGFVFQVVGDSFSASFPHARDALNAALDAQRSLHRESWRPAPIKVRM